MIPKILLFDICFQSVETASDYIFCVATIMAGHPWIGAAMIAPSLIILVYNVFKWISTNLLSKCEKFMIFMIPFLSPYLHLKLCISWLIESESEWRKKYDAIKQEYGNVDPFLKSIPSMFLKYSIFSILLVRDSGGANQNEAKSFCTIFQPYLEKMSAIKRKLVAGEGLMNPVLQKSLKYLERVNMASATK